MGALLAACTIFPRCSGSSTDPGSSDTDAGTVGDAGVDAGTTADAGTSASSWATGGTAAMTAKASYPDPFTANPSSCALTCEMTEGPCYDAASATLADISYGYGGLPMRMWFRLLDTSCNPISGASIDVWHVSPVGKYSGNDSANENVAFCTGSDADFESHLYFRGRQTTDASGKCFFDTCFPGWYSSRTIHVHLTIRVGGTAYLTTQLFFDDSLDDSIVASQPLYDTRGSRDTDNEHDTVVSANELSSYLFETARMPDGAMQSWKTIILRTSTSQSLCSG